MDEVSDMDDLNRLLKCTLSRHCGDRWIISTTIAVSAMMLTVTSC